MSTVFAIRRNLAYEGINESYMHAIHPLPTTTSARCAFFESGSSNCAVVFREDSFDPVTRIRRGRFYVDAGGLGATSQNSVYNGPYGPHIGAGGNSGWRADRYFRPIDPAIFRVGVCLEGAHVTLGESPFATNWRVVGAETITTGEILVTLRSVSLVGVIPELASTIYGNGGHEIDKAPIQKALDTLVDAFHKQQPTPIVDVTRETTRVILAAWVGSPAAAKDLGTVIPKIPKERTLVREAAYIVNRLHPRGKSAEQETRAQAGNVLRPVVDEDAETSVHLVGLVLREIGWAAS